MWLLSLAETLFLCEYFLFIWPPFAISISWHSLIVLLPNELLLTSSSELRLDDEVDISMISLMLGAEREHVEVFLILKLKDSFEESCLRVEHVRFIPLPLQIW
jgi:hypothetical protein